jgi:hypothetical protein
MVVHCKDVGILTVNMFVGLTTHTQIIEKADIFEMRKNAKSRKKNNQGENNNKQIFKVLIDFITQFYECRSRPCGPERTKNQKKV